MMLFSGVIIIAILFFLPTTHLIFYHLWLEPDWDLDDSLLLFFLVFAVILSLALLVGICLYWDGQTPM